MEADFLRWYGLDLRYEFHTRSARSLWALIQGLPPEAALHRGTDAAWTDLHEMTSMIAQALGVKIKRKKPQNVMSVSDFAAHYRKQADEGR